ncbi:MAG TPA: MarR family transcriptional regulator [Thermomicrobiales bacterium]|jgi:DNA-binding MarR family transcriptional regulator|nr:MarR family transcriptional regulator [Thermomicrobiales bacterium]
MAEHAIHPDALHECQVSDAAGRNLPVFQILTGWQRYLAALGRCLDAALREAGATSNQLTVLRVIARNEGLTQQQLSERLGLTKASTSQMLTRLESSGLIERVPEARAYVLRLTERSADLLRRAIPIHTDLIVQHFGVLDEDEQETLARLTNKLVEAIPD